MIWKKGTIYLYLPSSLDQTMHLHFLNMTFFSNIYFREKLVYKEKAGI